MRLSNRHSFRFLYARERARFDVATFCSLLAAWYSALNALHLAFKIFLRLPRSVSEGFLALCLSSCTVCGEAVGPESWRVTCDDSLPAEPCRSPSEPKVLSYRRCDAGCDSESEPLLTTSLASSLWSHCKICSQRLASKAPFCLPQNLHEKHRSEVNL